ncbi:site-2 protease family protein, partial [Candidatus Dojkabacteria bacterium]|nr:site-2 protease family protein [Candidatus Dojkabacteria bacterium]
KIGPTTYRINILPLGGYVQMQGEAMNREDTRPDSYTNKPLWRKWIILMAGIVMNIVFAIVVFAAFLAMTGYQVPMMQLVDYDFVGAQRVDTILPIVEVVEDSPAAGKLSDQDVIVEFNQQRLKTSAEFQELLKQNAGQTVQIGFVSLTDLSAEPSVVDVTLRSQGSNQPLLGVSYLPTYLVVYPASFLSAIPHTVNMFGYQVAAISWLVNQSVAESDPSIVLNEVRGFIGIGDLVGQVVQFGTFADILSLAALMSLALAFFNVLPIPLLDGGQAVLETIQTLTKNRIPESVINAVNMIGLVIIVILSIGITLKDAVQFNFLENIGSTIGRIFGGN